MYVRVRSPATPPSVSTLGVGITHTVVSQWKLATGKQTTKARLKKQWARISALFGLLAGVECTLDKRRGHLRETMCSRMLSLFSAVLFWHYQSNNADKKGSGQEAFVTIKATIIEPIVSHTNTHWTTEKIFTQQLVKVQNGQQIYWIFLKFTHLLIICVST